MSDVRPGVIMMWGGSSMNIPMDWLECDGRLLNIVDYDDLYLAVGTSFGKDAPPGKFYLPDLRGQFIRGVDSGANRDPNLDKRHDMQNPAKLYQGVGSVQDCALQDHKHWYDRVLDRKDGNEIKNGKDYRLFTVSSGEIVKDTPAKVSAQETRPINAYLYFLIKT